MLADWQVFQRDAKQIKFSLKVRYPYSISYLKIKVNHGNFLVSAIVATDRKEVIKLPTFTANLSTPFRGGETDRFRRFLIDQARADNIRVSHMQTSAWFRFDSGLPLPDLEKLAVEHRFKADFFHTEHEEEVS